MRISQVFLPLVAATLFMTGCGDKEPATSAVAQAEAAIEKVRPEAAQFSAPELQVADATLANMKANLAKEDYRAVVSEVPKFNTEMRTLKESIVSKQTLAVADQREWETLNQEVPKAVEAIQVRVDNLAGTKLPKEITKETFDTAKQELETIKTTWAEAAAAASAGNTTEAATKGRTVQAKAEELKTQLGMDADTAVASISKPAPGTN
jgi:predicted  nucleic acid-binding Zn-ribbon protein